MDSRALIAAGLAVLALGVAPASTALAQGAPKPKFVIVAIGDSFSSGEGNPLVPGLHDDRGRLAEAQHFPEVWGGQGTAADAQRCHRSPRAYSGVAAARIQQMHPELDVQLIHLGCSGASVIGGLLGPDDGVEGRSGEVPFDISSQVRKANDALVQTPAGDRRVDALLVSIGVNDVGFGTIVGTCLNPVEGTRPCFEVPEVQNVLGRGLEQLPQRLSQLGAAVHRRANGATVPALIGSQPGAQEIAIPQLAVQPARVHVVEYPDPTRDENGDFCAGTPRPLDPATSHRELFENATAAETEWMHANALVPLNSTLAGAVANQRTLGGDWRYVDGVDEAFRTHGLCATDSWITDNADALVSQGADALKTDAFAFIADPAVPTAAGTMHPTNVGHQRVADRVVASLDSQIRARTPALVVRSLTGPPARSSRPVKGRASARIVLDIVAPPGSDGPYDLRVTRLYNGGGKGGSQTKVDLAAGTTRYTRTGAGLFGFRIRQCTRFQCSAFSPTLRVSNELPERLGPPPRGFKLRRDSSQTRPPLPGPPDLLRNKTIKLVWSKPPSDWSYFELEYRRVRADGTFGRAQHALTTDTRFTLGSFLDPLGIGDRYRFRVRACSNLGCSARRSGAIVESVRTPAGEPLRR